MPTKHRVCIWPERGNTLYQKRIDTVGKREAKVLPAYARADSTLYHPLARNKFSVRNAICTRSGVNSELFRKLSRATSRVVKSSGVACPSPVVFRRYQRLCPPPSSEKTCREKHLERVNLIGSTKSVMS